MAANAKPTLDKRVISLEPLDLFRMSTIRGPQFSERIGGGILQENWYRDNTVVTSKYTWCNFIPKNLFMVQLTKLSNIYFLIISGMQMVPEITISNEVPAMLPPLILILCLAMLKDAWEDYKRHKADH